MIDAHDDSIGQLEQRLGTLLRTGVTLSALALSLGLAVWLARPDLPESGWLLRGGLFALMATPMVRVVVSLAGYIRMRDWVFVATTIVVLVELAISVMSAIHMG
jgi:uncharacterized membrane protein